jgi:hypothetical protein
MAAARLRCGGIRRSGCGGEPGGNRCPGPQGDGDRGSLGDFGQTLALFGAEFGGDRHRAPYGSLPVVIDVVADIDVDAAEIPAIALGVHPQRHRRAGGQPAHHQPERRGAGVSSGRDGFVGHQVMHPGFNVDLPVRDG